ncbi:helix-turn-helix domain-containing protein [Microbacterium sp. NPDC089696]|uniref:helix-turn-helix domain-containing protein n=1 Tax=Microbacterium sp. NPDC089696 TaxID=3364199 RepID=UPI003808435B
MQQPPRTLLEATRILRGLTQSDLASALGITQSVVSLLQSGAQRAPAALVTNIASALEMPEALLRRPSPAPRIGHLLRPSLPRTALNRALAEVTMAHAHVALLTDPVHADLDPRPDRNPDDLARRLRDRWAVAPGPITEMISILEANGIVCIYRDLSDLGVVALSSTAASGSTLMFLDRTASRMDLRWAIAHELGHLVMTDRSAKDSEALSDAFAIAFLLPEGDLRVDLDDIAAEAACFGVRPRVLAQRYRNLRLITDLQFRKLVREEVALADAELPPVQLGSPSIIADAVRAAGGSRHAAAEAFLSVDDLRQRYLARSQS